jgi:hypothetical protein
MLSTKLLPELTDGAVNTISASKTRNISDISTVNFICTLRNTARTATAFTYSTMHFEVNGLRLRLASYYCPVVNLTCHLSFCL